MDWAIPAAGDADDDGSFGGGNVEDLSPLGFFLEVVEVGGGVVVDADRLVWSGTPVGETRGERWYCVSAEIYLAPCRLSYCQFSR